MVSPKHPSFVLILACLCSVVGHAQIVPPVTIRVSANPTQGSLYIAPNNRIPTPPFAPALMVVGNDGKVLVSRVLNEYAYDFRIQPDGRLAYTVNRPNAIDTRASSSLFITDTALKSQDSITQAANSYTLSMESATVLPNGNRLIIGYDNLIMDMRRYAGEGAHPAAVVQQSVIQELDIDGRLLFQWKSIDHFPVTVSFEDLRAPFIRYFAVNSVEVDTDGNLLICARNASLIAKVHRTTGKVIWVLGGKLNQFTFTNEADPRETAEFSYPHDVRKIRNGNITLFDNGNQRTPQWSRACEYRVNELDKTCRLVWRYRKSPDLFASAQGSLQTLPNGNRLISWGAALSNNRTLITETDPTGGVVLEAELPNAMIPYRAERSLTPPGRHTADVLIDEILPTNTYTYTRGTDTVGVSITYHTLISFFYNTTTARRYMWSPENPRFVARRGTGAPRANPPLVLYQSRMTITQEGMESHGAEFRFKADLFGVTDPLNTVVYYRPQIGKGNFVPLPTRFNPNTRELVIDTSEVGEFCFGSPINPVPDSLVSPLLVSPVNGEDVGTRPIFIVSPQGHSTHVTYSLPRAGGTADTTTTRDAVQTTDTLAYGSYTWTAKGILRAANGAQLLQSPQAQEHTFVVRAPFIEIDSANVQQTWRRGRSYPISWRSNITGNVRIELVNNETILIAENVQAPSRGFLWSVPQTVPIGPGYSIRIRQDGIAIEDVTERNISIEEASSVASDDLGGVLIAPNPASDQVHIGGTQELSRIMVFSTSGAMTASYTVAGTGTSIDISPLAQGSYVMVLQGPNLSISKQLQIIR